MKYGNLLSVVDETMGNRLSHIEYDEKDKDNLLEELKSLFSSDSHKGTVVIANQKREFRVLRLKNNILSANKWNVETPTEIETVEFTNDNDVWEWLVK
jgi:hypothetical protein